MLDVIIAGAGPAGLSAAIYAKRAGLSAIVLDKSAAECQVTRSVEVENYLGMISVSGAELYSRFTEHARSCGVEIVKGAVLRVEKNGDTFKVYTRKNEYECKNLIIATGRTHRHIGVEGEERLSGAGVSYCATCDGYFFKDKEVCVIGGGDSALSQAIYLSKICRKVYLIHRRDSFRASNYLVERVKELSNVELLMNSVVSEIIGESFVEGVRYACDGEEKTLSCNGVFGAVGEIPNMKFTVEGLELNAEGYIKTDAYCRSNIDGIYAVGDIREKELYQIVTAVSDGALAISGILKEKI